MQWALVIRFHMKTAPLECEMYFAWPNCSGMHDAYLLGVVICEPRMVACVPSSWYLASRHHRFLIPEGKGICHCHLRLKSIAVQLLCSEVTWEFRFVTWWDVIFFLSHKFRIYGLILINPSSVKSRATISCTETGSESVHAYDWSGT